MAQLIKLQDYVSRYSQDIYLYPSRFVRLKKQQWQGIQEKWENGPDLTVFEKEEKDAQKEKNFIRKIKSIVRLQEDDSEDEISARQPEDSEALLDYSTLGQIQSFDELKQHFLDQLLPFQLKWASSTLSEKSFIDKEYVKDGTLKFLLQRFPDTFLVLYKPVFLLKKAPVEAELIIVTPAAAMCISFVEAEENAVFVGSKERFWIKKTKYKQEKILNPLLALNRTEKIVKTLFDLHGVELPVQKFLISRNGFIDYPMPPYGIQFIEKRNFDDWFMATRSMKSPLKHVQLKAAQVLLQFCQTTSFRRLEWNDEQSYEKG